MSQELRKRQYKVNRTFSDKLILAARRIAGSTLVEVASAHEDMKCATDLVVMVTQNTKWAFRVRRQEYLKRYGTQFTIRRSVPAGVPTEIDKIMDGYADRMLYGFADNVDIDPYFVIDLHRFRDVFEWEIDRKRHDIPPCRGGIPVIRSPWHGVYWPEVRVNKDGTSFFVFNMRSLPRQIIVDCSESADKLLPQAVDEPNSWIGPVPPDSTPVHPDDVAAVRKMMDAIPTK